MSSRSSDKSQHTLWRLLNLLDALGLKSTDDKVMMMLDEEYSLTFVKRMKR
jgi:hypothetical protein